MATQTNAHRHTRVQTALPAAVPHKDDADGWSDRVRMQARNEELRSLMKNDTVALSEIRHASLKSPQSTGAKTLLSSRRSAC
eukprot:998589-Rhodomonas_salina.2